MGLSNCQYIDRNVSSGISVMKGQELFVNNSGLVVLPMLVLINLLLISTDDYITNYSGICQMLILYCWRLDTSYGSNIPGFLFIFI